MFKLANKFIIPPDPTRCFLSGHAETRGIAWLLSLHSSALQINEREIDSEKVEFGIYCKDLQFPITDWKNLQDISLDVPEPSLFCAFHVYDWQDLVSLNITFGEVRGTSIEVFAEGVGLSEGSDLFEDSELSFSIQTWAQFLGISIDVPVNAPDFMAYANSRLRCHLPGYSHGESLMRRAVDDSGILRGVDVFYPPL